MYTKEGLKRAFDRSRGVFSIIEEEGEYEFEIAEVAVQGEDYSIKAIEIESSTPVYVNIRHDWEFAGDKLLQLLASVSSSIDELAELAEGLWAQRVIGRRFSAYCTVNEYVGRDGKVKRVNNLKNFTAIEAEEG